MDLSNYLNAKKDFGVLVLRLVTGYRLVEGMVTVLFKGYVPGMASFFAAGHIPFPSISTYLAVYAELICGILYIIGFWTRPAAAVMIFTFTVALAFVDIQAGFEKAFPAWSIWAISLFLLFNGAGKLSVDGKIKSSSK